MKKLIGVAIGGVVLLAVAAALAVVGYRQGWFSRTGLKPPAGSAGGIVAGGQEAGRQASAGGGGQTSLGAGGGVAGPGTQAAAPQFDGNVAALVWGGKVERARGSRITIRRGKTISWT